MGGPPQTVTTGHVFPTEDQPMATKWTAWVAQTAAATSSRAKFFCVYKEIYAFVPDCSLRGECLLLPIQLLLTLRRTKNSKTRRKEGGKRRA